MNRPLCFVLMPFGQKMDAGGLMIDFNAVYHEVIQPAIIEADMEPLRADEEMNDGIIHKAMFERLLMCPYAIADLTTANANVFYELGVRHAARPWSTVLLFAGTSRLPFDVAPLRALPYSISAAGTPDKAEETQAALVERLRDANGRVTATGTTSDSPLFQLIKGFPSLMEHLDPNQLESFQTRMQDAAVVKEQLAEARVKGNKSQKQGIESIQAIERDLGPIKNQEDRVTLDLFHSYYFVGAWPEMIALARKMPAPLANSVTVREQLALALNRAGQSERAERVLRDLLEQRGPSSETYGLLGRVYKDRWDAADKAGKQALARGLLDKAIDAYMRGFETDWRDAYPGINACTLMAIRKPPDPRLENILPVVTYAVERKIASGKPDYWDYATVLELAVLAKDEQRAMEALGQALATTYGPKQPESTAGNLRLIREKREQRGEVVSWAQQIEEDLKSASNP
jgi:hypothetical protein